MVPHELQTSRFKMVSQVTEYMVEITDMKHIWEKEMGKGEGDRVKVQWELW